MQGAIPILDDAVEVGLNDACNVTYYTKKTPEESIIAINALLKAKGFAPIPIIGRPNRCLI